MKPTSSSASSPDPGDTNTARPGGVSQAVALPRWQSKVPAVVGAILAVAVLVDGFLWYRYGSSWGSDQGGNRALAALRAEPIPRARRDGRARPTMKRQKLALEVQRGFA